MKNNGVLNLLMMGGATASRLVGILILYATLARVFGPGDFGEFAYWYAIGVMLGALSDYGFGQQILVNLSIGSREDIRDEARRIVLAKSFLVFFLFFIAFVFCAATNDYEKTMWIGLLLLSCVAITFVDFFGVILRARGCYRNEATRSFVSSFVSSVAAAAFGYLTDSLSVVCAVLFFSRLFVFYYQYKAAAKEIDFCFKFNFISDSKSALNALRSGFKFAVDGWFLQLFANLDVIFVKFILVGDMAGVYMAGNRLVQAALSGLPVLSNVFIPMIVLNKQNGISILPKALVVSVVGAALLCFFVFLFGGDFISSLMFGKGFLGLSELMPYFGSVVMLRYLSSLDGFRLLVYGRKRFRVAVHVISILAFSGLVVFFGSDLLVFSRLLVLILCFYVVAFRLGVAKFI